MTLIVVTENRVLANSYESNGTPKFEIGSKKVRPHRVILGKFVVAGSVPDWSIAVSRSKEKKNCSSLLSLVTQPTGLRSFGLSMAKFMCFELACSLHPQCSLPVNMIEIEDRT